MYFHVYLIYRFTRTFTDHSSVITRCWGFELQNGKSSLKSPQTLATQDFAPASFLSTPDTSSRTVYRSRRLFFKKSSLTHSVAPPLQMRPAVLGSHLVFGHRARGTASILFTLDTSSRTAYRSRRLFFKSHLSLIPSLLLSKCDPLRWARIGSVKS